jgi:hypothetical protein
MLDKNLGSPVIEPLMPGFIFFRKERKTMSHFKVNCRCVGLVFLAVIFLAGPVHAAIPRTLNFQGYLTNPGGNPVQGPVTMVFSLYVQETGGSALWTETHLDVQVTNGIYSVLLGETTPLGLPFDGPYYLGIRLGTDPEMTPRLALTSVGYALRAGTADQALIQGFPVGPIVPTANQVLKFNGTNWVPSSVNLSTDTSGVLPIDKGGTDPGRYNFIPRTNTINNLNNPGYIRQSSIAIGGDGFPVISYPQESPFRPRLAKCGDAACTPSLVTIRDIDSDGGLYQVTSTAIGADGFPVISYNIAALKLAKCGDATCSTMTVQTVDSTALVGRYNSIAIGTDGFPVISYYDVTNGDLKIAKCGNASCSSVMLRTLDSTNDVGQFTSIAIGTDGFPVISYYDVTSGDLKVAKCGGDATCSSVTLQTIDTIGNVGQSTSIAIGTDGFPVISYYDAGNRYLKLAKCGDAACTSALVILRTLDSSGNVGMDTSVAIGTDGFPVISYCENFGGGLKLAKCGDPTCSSASVTLKTLGSPGWVGSANSITIGADGFPVISYCCSTDGEPIILKCANAHCLNNWWRR